MSLRSLVPFLALVACAGGAPVDDDVAESDDTDEAEVDLATAWSGTWSFTWQYTDKDWSYQGPGEKWDPVDSSCTSGTVSLTIDDDGVLVVDLPYGSCLTGTQIGWTTMALDATLDTDTQAIRGDALFGTVTGSPPGLNARTGLQITGFIGDDEQIEDGLLTLSGSRSQNQAQPTENLAFSATLRPVR